MTHIWQAFNMGDIHYGITESENEILSNVSFYKKCQIINDDFLVGELKLSNHYINITSMKLEDIYKNKESLFKIANINNIHLSELNSSIKEKGINLEFYITEHSSVEFMSFVRERSNEYQEVNSVLINYLEQSCIKQVFANYLETNNTNNNKKFKMRHKHKINRNTKLKRKYDLTSFLPKIAIKSSDNSYVFDEELLNEYMVVFSKLKKDTFTYLADYAAHLSLYSRSYNKTQKINKRETVELLREMVLKAKLRSNPTGLEDINKIKKKI